MDYSLEQIKLREIYEKVYRKTDFSFSIKHKDYTKSVICVTFQYSLKQYNLIRKNIYVKYGYAIDDVSLIDRVDIRNGELVAIQVGENVLSPIPEDVLGSGFRYDEETHTYEVGTIPLLMTVADLRRELYRDGFLCDGQRYVRYKRSTGSSRIGNCLFIDESLYARIFTWSKCGIRVRQGREIDLAAFEASIALTLSSIIDTLEIRPENILVIDDYESNFKDKVAVTRLDASGKLDTRIEEVDISNNIWDGQSLIDQSAMGTYQDKGFVLLRNRFFKSACFNCNLQAWFSDHGITTTNQLHGFTLAREISQIKLITTPSSIKYLKFGKIEDWLSRIDPLFGVVKFEKPTHYFGGRLVQTHYQLLNSLCLSQKEVDDLLTESLDYVHQLRTDPKVLRHHIKYIGNDTDRAAKTKNDIVYKMLGVNERFCQTRLYYEFVKDIVDSYIKNLRCGHVLVSGTYATMVGNPIEMLMSAIGTFEGKSILGAGNIHSIRFQYGQKVLGSRSPHVTMGNVWVPTNAESTLIDRYLNLTNEIVCVNSIDENTMNRLSGCDFDSDTVLLSDHPLLIAKGMECQNFYVPTHMVTANKVKRHYTIEDLAALDIATSVNKIGEIVNLSQELNTLIWDRLHHGASFNDILPIYLDTAQLDVLSNIEIDKAKREYAVNSTSEITAIKQRYGIVDADGRKVKPNFFAPISKKKGYYDNKRNVYKSHQTTMDFLQKTINKRKTPRKSLDFLPFHDVLDMSDYNRKTIKYDQIDRIIEMVRESRARIKGIWSLGDEVDPDTKWRLAMEEREGLAEFIRSARISKSTMVRLLRSIDDAENSDISRTLFFSLFSAPNESLFEMIQQSKKQLSIIVEQSDGDIFLYGIPHGIRFMPEEP